MPRYPFARTDVTDLVPLTDELSAELGRPVTLVARAEQTVDEPVLDDDGNPTGETEPVHYDGVLIVVDPETGDELDVDHRKVARVVKAHKPPPSQAERREEALADAEAKAAAGDTAGALADVLELLRQGAR